MLPSPHRPITSRALKIFVDALPGIMGAVSLLLCAAFMLILGLTFALSLLFFIFLPR